MKEIKVKIHSIISNMTDSILFLDETNGIRMIPIWIGPFEAQSILMKMSGYTSPRPMTHDLIYRIINQLNAKVIKVLISDIEYDTYFSIIFLLKDDKIIEIDARPSDAIALSVRTGCPIYVRENVFNKTQVLNKPITEEEVRDFKEKLKNLTPKDIIGENPQKEKKGDNDEQKTDN